MGLQPRALLVLIFVRHRCFSSSRGISCYHTEYWRNYKTFFSAFTAIGLQRFIRIEDALHEMRIYRDEYICDRSPGAPSKAVAEGSNSVSDGDLDNGD